MSTVRAPTGIGCVYLISERPKYSRMLKSSVAGLRRHSPDVPVIVFVVTPDPLGEEAAQQIAELEKLVDVVRAVEPLDVESGYFCDNKQHLADTGFAHFLYLDADTFVFGDIRRLFDEYAHCDLVARPSDWAFRVGYRASMVPDVLCPVNGGVVLMSDAFVQQWAQQMRTWNAEVRDGLEYPELVAWLERISPHKLWPREEWSLALAAWRGDYRVALMTDRDCHLLADDPENEIAANWVRSTIFHTYTAYWERCAKRLQEAR